jgi:hypothetical protein
MVHRDEFPTLRLYRLGAMTWVTTTVSLDECVGRVANGTWRDCIKAYNDVTLVD